MFKGLGSLGDMSKIVKAAGEAQQKMADLRADLEKIEVSGESGAGLVKATVTTTGKVVGLEIDPTIFHPNEKNIVEDLIIAAISEAQKKGEEKKRHAMEKLGKELGLPTNIDLPL